MAEMIHCWRCAMTMPMLNEEEWRKLAPLMTFETKQQALDRFHELTGHEETNFNALWHHRISLYGPPCKSCGKPLRTARATWCAACGRHERGTSELLEWPSVAEQPSEESLGVMVQQNEEQISEQEETKRYLHWGVIVAVLLAILILF